MGSDFGIASCDFSSRAPEYPKLSQRYGERGTVVLSLTVRSDGTVSDVAVKSSSGFLRLDRAAVDAIKNGRCRPTTVDGKAVDKSYEVPITFKPPN
jgi:protein TonB